MNGPKRQCWCNQCNGKWVHRSTLWAHNDLEPETDEDFVDGQVEDYHDDDHDAKDNANDIDDEDEDTDEDTDEEEEEEEDEEASMTFNFLLSFLSLSFCRFILTLIVLFLL